MQPIKDNLLQKALCNELGHFYLLSANALPFAKRREFLHQWVVDFLQQFLRRKYPQKSATIDIFQHPDFLWPGTSQEKIERSNNYLLQELQTFFDFCRFRPYELQEKWVVISDAHRLSDLAVNKMLKSLEEAPPNLTIFLLAPSAKALLPTLTSRATELRLQAPSIEEAQSSDTELKEKSEVAKMLENFLQTGLGLQTLCQHLKNTPEDQHFILESCIEWERNLWSDYQHKNAFLQLIRNWQVNDTFNNSAWGKWGSFLLGLYQLKKGEAFYAIHIHQ